MFAYGRMPLAFSARCFTARHFNLQKDDCQFKCLEFPDGLLIKTREGEEFLTLNGIQTQSSKVYNLIGEVDALRDLGVDILRISPQSQHTRDIARHLPRPHRRHARRAGRAQRDGRTGPGRALQRLLVRQARPGPNCRLGRRR